MSQFISLPPIQEIEAQFANTASHIANFRAACQFFKDKGISSSSDRYPAVTMPTFAEFTAGIINEALKPISAQVALPCFKRALHDSLYFDAQNATSSENIAYRIHGLAAHLIEMFKKSIDYGTNPLNRSYTFSMTSHGKKGIILAAFKEEGTYKCLEEQFASAATEAREMHCVFKAMGLDSNEAHHLEALEHAKATGMYNDDYYSIKALKTCLKVTLSQQVTQAMIAQSKTHKLHIERLNSLKSSIDTQLKAVIREAYYMAA